MKSQRQQAGSTLLMGMVEKVCAPILERTLDTIELEALRVSRKRLLAENAELRDALQIPREIHASEQVIASAALTCSQQVAPQTADLVPGLPAPAPDRRPSISIASHSAAVLL